ncbi:GNAT family N-acetyltransferase [Nonomuraea sp. NBC_01738]|uniref:GNAT family N-acetyltransferase n=1 Tax=Nonomuraea sp. NBC_01738 TaxID=2976003 RepID=UPI002E13BABA|nr:GNAT family N-acetyltransferase [Nonomuraea sp. NBC_01738]
MFPREVISTGQLVLRPPSSDDAESVAVACDDPVTARFLPLLASPYTLRDAHAYLASAAERWELGGAEFSIVRDGVYAGSVGLTPPDRWGVVDLGYTVAPQARGQGVGAAAARAVTDWALDHGARRVQLEAEVENLASLRVAYKAGFMQEGVRREAKALRDGRRSDLVMFSRLPGETLSPPPKPYLPFFPTGQLSDGVVRLTPMGERWAADFQKMMDQPSVRRYSLGPPLPPEEQLRRCRYTGFYWMSGQRVELAVRDAVSGEFAGHLQLMQIAPVLAQGMIGYSLMEGFQGRGFMTRAVNLLVDWAFGHTALRRIVAGTEVDNTASHRVLERAGFTRESVNKGLLPRPDGTWADDVTWVRMRPPSA